MIDQADEKAVDFRLRVKNLGKHYADMLLFKNVGFELCPGDSLAITGWNGSGKSTMLRIIAGLTKSSAGQVDFLLNSRSIPTDLRRRYFGMITPALSLYSELTALENLRFFTRVRGLVMQPGTIEDLIERVGLHGRGDDICGTFSSGMLQRLKLAQALLHQPLLLLLDEPCSNLDQNGVAMVEKIISEQRSSGITIIASNEQREIDYADRCINLSE
ncbi:ATP-binding cassette domain-containing protein [candidate division KSB1 bacterium]|nr:ATP-binding cassette domain-containing protein [candidate division KSB1 bacterium]